MSHKQLAGLFLLNTSFWLEVGSKVSTFSSLAGPIEFSVKSTYRNQVVNFSSGMFFHVIDNQLVM